MKVLLTTIYCKPPLTRTIFCDEVKYFENQHKLSMYAKKGKTNKLIAYTFVDEWQNILIVGNDGKSYNIK